MKRNRRNPTKQKSFLCRTVQFLAGLLVCTMLFSLCLASVASAESVQHTITFNANGGRFDNDDTVTTNAVPLSYDNLTLDPTVQYAASHNVNMETGYASSTYSNGRNDYLERSTTNAKLMQVEIWYSMESTSYDWVEIQHKDIYGNWVTYKSDYDGNTVGSTESNKLGRISGQSGNSTGSYEGRNHNIFRFATDDLRFYFHSDGSQVYYGYYAKITSWTTTSSPTITGTYKAPNRTVSADAPASWNTKADGTGTSYTIASHTDLVALLESHTLNTTQTLYAIWNPVSGEVDPSSPNMTTKVIFNANGGRFDDNDAITTNEVTYTYGRILDTSYAHSPNVNDSGYASGTYSNNDTKYIERSKPGAKLIQVDIWYSMESTQYDWVEIQHKDDSGNWVTYTKDADNQTVGSVESGKLGRISGQLGNTTGTYTGHNHNIFHFNTDELRFYFKTDQSQTYWGYYAIIKTWLPTGDPVSTSGTYKAATKAGSSAVPTWNTKQDGTGTSYTITSAAEFETLMNSHVLKNNQILYAIWPPEFTIHYDPNPKDGDSSLIVGEMADKTNLIPGSAVELDPNTYIHYVNENHTRQYVFAGWTQNQNGSGTVYEDMDTIPGSITATFLDTVTLYAQWEQSQAYTIHFLPNAPSGKTVGGNMSDDIADSYTVDHTLPPNRFFVNGYRFSGWKDRDDSTKTYANRGTISGNTYADTITEIWLQAQWDPLAEGELQEVEIGFELKSGQQARIPNLPAGTGYQVWEETEAGWVLRYEVDKTGEILTNTTVTDTSSNAVFRNDYSPDEISASIAASKQLDGKAPGSAAFSFTLTQTGGPNYNASSPYTETKTSNSSGAISFTTLTFTASGDYTYTITETPGADSSIAYDSTPENVTIHVTKDENNKLSADVEYDVGESTLAEDKRDEGAVFKNEHKEGSLRIRKQVLSGDDQKDFEFTLTLRDSSGEPVTGVTADGLSSKMNESVPVAGVYTCSLKHGESILIKHLPYGAFYSVDEASYPGWTAECDSASGTIKADTDPDAENPDHTSEVLYKNTYTPGGAPGGDTEVRLQAHKSMEEAELSADQFHFNLDKWDTATSTWKNVEQISNGAPDNEERIPVPPANPGDEVTSVENPWYGTGLVSFQSMKFKAPEVAVFRVTEISTDDSSINFDENVFYAIVNVTDNGQGKLNAEVTWFKNGTGTLVTNEDAGTGTVTYSIQDGTPADEAALLFENSLKKSALIVKKQMRDATNAAMTETFEFTVTLRKADGTALVLNPIPTGLTAVTGTPGAYTFGLKGGEQIKIENLPYGTHYDITEAQKRGFDLLEKTNDVGEILDEDVTSTFVNTDYAVGSTEAPIRKIYRGGSIEENQFYILVERSKTSFQDPSATHDDLLRYQWAVPMAVANNQGEAISAFRLPLNFNFEDVEDGTNKYYYRFTEVQGDPDTNILYSQATYYGHVDLTNDGSGNITPTFTFEQSVNEASFTNIRLLELYVEKEITGNVADPNKEFDFTVKLRNLPSEGDYDGDPNVMYTVDAPTEWGTATTTTETTDDGSERDWQTWTFRMGNDGHTSVYLPYGTAYAVSEDPDGYRPSLLMSRNLEELHNALQQLLADLRRADSRSATLKNNQYLHFRNTLNAAVPTGVVVASGGGLTVAALAGLGVMKSRRKKREEEEREEAEPEQRSGGRHLRN